MNLILPEGQRIWRKAAPIGGFSLGSNVSASLTSGAVPTITGALSVITGNDRGGTTTVIPVNSSVGVTGVTFGGSSATSVVLTDATHVTCVTPAHAVGAVDVVVTNGTGPSAPSVGGFTYLDATSVGGLLAWWRADKGATLVSGDLDVLADQSGTGNTNLDFTAGSAGVRPKYTTSYAPLNNRAAWGTLSSGAAVRYMITGSIGTPLATPVTWYQVVYPIVGTCYWRLDTGGSTSNCQCMYGAAGGGAGMYAQDGVGSGANFTLATNNTAYIVICDFNAAFTVDVSISKYNTVAASGVIGSQACANIWTGTFLGDPQEYMQSEIIAYSGNHNSATKQLIAQSYLGDAYAISVTA